MEQVYYSNWGDELSPGHENYWKDISDISIMIGNDLISPFQRNYHLDEEDDYLNQMSSIVVLQTKEKFGEVRVYCRLGSEYIISKEYSKEVSKAEKQNESWRKFLREGIKPSHYSKWWEKSMRENYPLSPPETDEYFQKRVFEDIMHYRSVYFKYFRLFPHYKNAIISGADHSEYLFETKKEADLYIQKERVTLEKHSKEYEWDEEVVQSRYEHINKTEEIIEKIFESE